MDPVKIVSHMCDNGTGSMALWGVVAQAFETTHPVELLKRRALFIEHCIAVMDELGYEEDEREAMYDIFEVIAFKNLGIPIKDMSSKLTKAHKASVLGTFRHYQSIKREYDVDEIVQISYELRDAISDEELTEEQEVILIDICDAVVQAKAEHNIVGGRAIQKLYEILLGKVILYKNEITQIKSPKIKVLITKLYTKTHEVNKVMGFVLSLKKNASGLLDMIGLL